MKGLSAFATHKLFHFFQSCKLMQTMSKCFSKLFSFLLGRKSFPRRGSMDFADFVGLFPRFPPHVRCWRARRDAFEGLYDAFWWVRLRLGAVLSFSASLGCHRSSIPRNKRAKNLAFCNSSYLCNPVWISKDTVSYSVSLFNLELSAWSVYCPAEATEAVAFLSTGYGRCFQGKVSWSSSDLALEHAVFASLTIQQETLNCSCHLESSRVISCHVLLLTVRFFSLSCREKLSLDELKFNSFFEILLFWSLKILHFILWASF